MHNEQTQGPMTDQIRADRACVHCGFNLYGQTVTKEDHYGLAIARCPECGTVAALQQYPVMTHWVNRFRALLTGLYLVLLLGFFALSTVGVSAFAINSASLASEPLADHIGLSFTIWTTEQAQAAQAKSASPQTTTAAGGTTTTFTLNGQATTVTTTPTTGVSYSPGSYRWVTLTPEWIDNHMDASISDFGSLWSKRDPEIYVFMVPAAFVSVCIGIFWSVALLGASRKKALLVPLAAVLIGMVFLIGMNMDDQYYLWASNVARHLYVSLIVPFFMGFQLLFLAIGIWVGRAFARAVVRMALPPRSRLPLAILWTRDGLALPKP